jgi:flavin-binding protein dodecin
MGRGSCPPKWLPNILGVYRFPNPRRLPETGVTMAVEKSIDLTATGRTVEEAVAEAVGRASMTLEGVDSFEIVRVDGRVEGNDITYRVHLRLSFFLKEEFHG